MLWRRDGARPTLPAGLSRLTSLVMTCLFGDAPGGLYRLTQLRHLQLCFHEADDSEGALRVDGGHRIYNALRGLRVLVNLRTLDVSGDMKLWMPAGLSCLTKLESCSFLAEKFKLHSDFSLGAHLTELELHYSEFCSPLPHEPGNNEEDVRHWVDERMLLTYACLPA